MTGRETFLVTLELFNHRSVRRITGIHYLLRFLDSTTNGLYEFYEVINIDLA